MTLFIFLQLVKFREGLLISINSYYLYSSLYVNGKGSVILVMRKLKFYGSIYGMNIFSGRHRNICILNIFRQYNY